jgi:hypothetical protein
MTDYLWDKRGDVDSDVERLERALHVFAQSTPPPPFSELGTRSSGLGTPGSGLGIGARWIGIALLAASVAIAVGGLTLSYRARPALPVSAWQVARDGIRSSLPVGGWLETGDRERARFNVANIGEVVVEPRTRLQLLSTRDGEHRLALARGTMHARIWAPPNKFFVETPSTLAIDLGCAYTLTVDDEGAGLVSVLVGWVGF